MDRKGFIKTCGFACLSGGVLSLAMQSCTTNKMVTGEIDNSNLAIPLSSFQDKNDKFRKYVIVQHDQLKYPICVYRFSDKDYTALLMRCTHQGTELQVFGDRLECPAHGSEFNNRGLVQNGPADTNLRTLPVTVQNNQILISLK